MIKKLLFTFIVSLLSITAQAQFVVSPNAVLIDSDSGKDYIVLDIIGTKSELYDRVIRNLYLTVANPDKSVSKIGDEMISAMVSGTIPVKYAGFSYNLQVVIVYKFQFKNNKIRISGNWIDVHFNGNQADVITILNRAGVRCFNEKGEINNEKRFNQYSKLSNDLLAPLISFEQAGEEW